MREKLNLEKTEGRRAHPNIRADPGMQLWDPEKDSMRLHFMGESGD